MLSKKLVLSIERKKTMRSTVLSHLVEVVWNLVISHCVFDSSDVETGKSVWREIGRNEICQVIETVFDI